MNISILKIKDALNQIYYFIALKLKYMGSTKVNLIQPKRFDLKPKYLSTPSRSAWSRLFWNGFQYYSGSQNDPYETG